MANECPERIEEANTLMREAEQALAQGTSTIDRAVVQEKLKAAQALVHEAEMLHNASDHDASVDKAYAALAAAKEVRSWLKP
jgi:hypothetical protein